MVSNDETNASMFPATALTTPFSSDHVLVIVSNKEPMCFCHINLVSRLISSHEVRVW